MRHQLKIVVPVSIADVHLLEGWVNVIRAVSLKNHPVEFHPTPNVASITNDAAQAIKHVCNSVVVIPTPKDYKTGYPNACNTHYGQVMRSLAMRQNPLPWLWAELDMLPLSANPADQLITEYVLTGGTGAMGVIMPMVTVRDEGKPSQYVHVNKADLYMVGVAVYDPNYFFELGGLSDQLFNVHNIPFDMHLRNYTRKRWRSTEMISTASKTHNYRIEGDRIVFDDLPDKKPWDMRAGSVPRGTVWHHGCKDLSLAKLIVEQMGRPYQTLSEMLEYAAAVVPQITTTPVMEIPKVIAPEQQPEVPTKPQSDAALASVFAAMKQQHPQDEPKGPPKVGPLPVAAPPPARLVDPEKLPPPPEYPETITQGATGVSEAVGTLSQPDAPASAPTAEDLRKAIAEANKPMKVANFAQMFNTTEDAIKSVAKQPQSGVNIVGGVWMKLGG